MPPSLRVEPAPLHFYGQMTGLGENMCSGFKKMAPLIVGRFDLIPTKWGADWRDLPNKVVMLSDRSKKQVLEYNHRDTTCGNGPNGAFRGYVRAPSDNPSTRQKTGRQTP